MNGARFTGVDKQIGSIEAGKAADLVLLKGNPAQHIKDIENIVAVFKGRRRLRPRPAGGDS